jgi:hypothetical protein
MGFRKRLKLHEGAILRPTGRGSNPIIAPALVLFFIALAAIVVWALSHGHKPTSQTRANLAPPFSLNPAASASFRKAIPEPVFKYRSKSAARVLLLKHMAIRSRHGLNRAVDRTMPSLC